MCCPRRSVRAAAIRPSTQGRRPERSIPEARFNRRGREFRQPFPGAIGPRRNCCALTGGPRVRIRLPPAESLQTPGPAEPEMASLIVKVRYARNQASPARRQPLNQKHPVRNPPRPASADLWRREPRATGPLPAFMRRPRPIKASWMSCPDTQRGRSAAT
jgi:hypothetical protein